MKLSTTQNPIEKEIAVLYAELRTHESGSDEYATVLDRIVKLTKLKHETANAKVSPDTVVSAGVNLLGIIMILKYEHVNVITSKAMSFVRLR